MITGLDGLIEVSVNSYMRCRCEVADEGDKAQYELDRHELEGQSP